MDPDRADRIAAGKEAIRQRYLGEVKAMNAPIIEDVYVADERRCLVEFVVDHPEHGRVAIVDVFDIDRAVAALGWPSIDASRLRHVRRSPATEDGGDPRYRSARQAGVVAGWRSPASTREDG